MGNGRHQGLFTGNEVINDVFRRDSRGSSFRLGERALIDEAAAVTKHDALRVEHVLAAVLVELALGVQALGFSPLFELDQQYRVRRWRVRVGQVAQSIFQFAVGLNRLGVPQRFTFGPQRAEPRVVPANRFVRFAEIEFAEFTQVEVGGSGNGRVGTNGA